MLHLLSWLKTQVDWDIEVLINGRGPLLDEFRSVCKTTVYRNPDKLLRAFPPTWRKVLQPSLENLYTKVLFLGRGFDLIYANTSAAWPQINVLVERTPALLWHIHELGYAIRLLIGENMINQTFKAATRFVAVSYSVRNTLVYDFNVPIDNVDIIQGFVSIYKLTSVEKRLRRRQVLDKLSWPDDAFVVGGCGSLGWRKGTDLFLQIAHKVSQMKGYEKVRFLWVGGEERDQESLAFAHDVRALGLQEFCSRIPTTAEVSDLYSAMDVFALTSREDPFPLVMLEAGSYGIPVVCFADSGGGPEFVGVDAGLTAPYLDQATFVSHLMMLHDDPALRKRLGAAALQKVQLHHVVESQGPKLLKCIEHCMGNSRKKRGT